MVPDKESNNISFIFSIKLRTFVLIIVLLTYLPAFFFTLYYSLDERNKALAEAEKKVELTLESTQAKVEKSFGDIERTLILLANSTAVKNGAPEECNSFLANTLSDYSQYINFGVADKDGNVVCSALTLDRQLNLSDRSYFLDAEQLKSLAIGRYRINQITQEPSISFGYPILGEGNTVEKVVFASVDANWFNTIAEVESGQSNTVVNLIDRKGTLLARQPDPHPYIGKSLFNQPLVSTVMAQNEGEIEIEGLDSVKRHYKFLPLQYNGISTNGYIAVGTSLEESLFRVDKVFLPILVFLGMGSGLLALALVAGKSNSSF